MRMDTKYPELFQSRSGQTARDASVLHPCSRFQKRASRVFNDLSIAPLAFRPSTTFAQPTNEQEALAEAHEVPKGSIFKPCAPIHTKSFYRTFNRFARDLYIERKDLGEDIIGSPVLFDLKGQLIEESKLKKLSRKGGIFEKPAEMPSSCKDIRMFPSIFKPSTNIKLISS